MRQNTKLFLHDLRNVLGDKKTLLVIIFLTMLTHVICISICFTAQFDNENFLTQLKLISDIKNTEIFVSYIVYMFSFIIFSFYPFMTGILIVSHLKEFGELELMMLLPVNRKSFFTMKILCIFAVSLFFSWISIFVNSVIIKVILHASLSFNFSKLLFAVVSLPAWLFSLSGLTVVLSSLARDSKESNQKSLIITFMLYLFIQVAFMLKINIFSPKIIFVPLISAIILQSGLFCFSRSKLNIEKILYSK